jgi:hypothetical protein
MKFINFCISRPDGLALKLKEILDKIRVFVLIKTCITK